MDWKASNKHLDRHFKLFDYKDMIFSDILYFSLLFYVLPGPSGGSFDYLVAILDILKYIFISNDPQYLLIMS